jgi:hypothetical protein
LAVPGPTDPKTAFVSSPFNLILFFVKKIRSHSNLGK